MNPYNRYNSAANAASEPAAAASHNHASRASSVAPHTSAADAHDLDASPARIKVLGIGGAGMNAINRMLRAHLEHVDFIAINTDEQDLEKTLSEKKIGIGRKTTRGMGAGGDPELGERAALEDRERLQEAIRNADMIFITAGMGGGTGTGAAPVVAELAKQLGILTVGVITLPFTMEGQRRMKIAQAGAARLRGFVDTLITIQNDSVFRVIDNDAPVAVAFQKIDDILLHAIGGISDLIHTTGLINVDFADVCSVMGQRGDAIMGAGEAAGPDRIEKAVDQAIHNALLAEDVSIDGARAILINVSGSSNLGMTEWKEVTEYMTRLVDKDANIIVGLTLNENLEDKIRVLVIATGFSTPKTRSSFALASKPHAHAHGTAGTAGSAGSAGSHAVVGSHHAHDARGHSSQAITGSHTHAHARSHTHGNTAIGRLNKLQGHTHSSQAPATREDALAPKGDLRPSQVRRLSDGNGNAYGNSNGYGVSRNPASFATVDQELESVEDVRKNASNDLDLPAFLRRKQSSAKKQTNGLG